MYSNVLFHQGRVHKKVVKSMGVRKRVKKYPVSFQVFFSSEIIQNQSGAPQNTVTDRPLPYISTAIKTALIVAPILGKRRPESKNKKL